MEQQITDLEDALAITGAQDPETLQQLAVAYPYFAPVQFLLLKKLDPSTEAYRRQYQKALLYYHDPLQLEFLLHREKFETELPKLVEQWKEEGERERERESERERGEAAAYAAPVEIVDTPAFAPNEDEAIAQEITEEPAPVEMAVTTTEQPAAITETAQEPLAFEPFHTVDYFASQGIKLGAADTGSDKLGRQLKSFTDWLKTMKRLPEPESAPGQSEQKVERLAVHSVETSDVVTESMAEVWLKQGNKEKAIEVYRKLSLLNPSKMAYFAAKIQNLNE
jgi:hypothetical protein